MNPTGNYHIPLKYFMENNNFTVYMVDSRKTLHLRKMTNLNTIKSDSEDAHILAATSWHDPKYREYKGHNRSSLSNISRERSIVVKNITAIKNYMYSDIAATFPEFIDLYNIDSSTGLTIFYEYVSPHNIVNAGLENIIKLKKFASYVLGKIGYGKNHMIANFGFPPFCIYETKRQFIPQDLCINQST